MKMIFRSFSSLYFLHLERSSAILIPGVSSMIRLEFPTTPALSISFSHSASARLPVRRCWESTLDSMEKS